MLLKWLEGLACQAEQVAAGSALLVDVLIIGAGQAGLAAANALKPAATNILVVDRQERVGAPWRQRYRSLTLFTPRSLSALPGLPLEGDPDGYASGEEFADYLERYSKRLDVPTRLGAEVVDLRQSRDGMFSAQLDSGEVVTARAVIVATGAFQCPVVPAFAKEVALALRQFDSTSYREPQDVPAGPVLVVGDGASGRDIAVDLARSHAVILACGRSRRLLPERLLGISTWKWLQATGLLAAPAQSPLGRLMRRADPFPNRGRSFEDLRRLGIDLRPRLADVSGNTARFQDGSRARIGAVIWTLGYRDDFGWLQIPNAFDAGGGIVNHEGRSPVDGLWYVGRPWQRNRASGLILGAGPDAHFVAEQVNGWTVRRRAQ